ncbi:MAG: RluA family pseudouridine synthase [Pseudomonadota bacterium]
MVDIDEAGVRLDTLLAERRPDLSRTLFLRLIKEGLVILEGVAVKPSHRVTPGDEVSVTIPPPEPTDIVAEFIHLDILFEDSDLLVINKPPDLVVHPSPGHESHTLVNALMHHSKNLSGMAGEDRPGIVHRLDKDTSGVMMAAKNDRAHRVITDQFVTRTVKKRYLALVMGDMGGDQGTIDLPIGRHPSDRKRMAATSRGGRSAQTLWEVRERFGCATLLSVRILTGRTHQIRVHLSALGHPVAGDVMYGRPGGQTRLKTPSGMEIPVPRQMLHARKLSFLHPVTGEELSFKAPLQPDMEAVLAALRESVAPGRPG